MRARLLFTAFAGIAPAPTASAQGLAHGARDGAERGEMVAGPLGAFVGGAIGAAVRTANGILGVDRRERFRIHALGERRPSFALRGPLRAGSALPEDDVVYYDVPREFALPEYSCTIVDGHPVLVEPRTRRVLEVVD